MVTDGDEDDVGEVPKVVVKMNMGKGSSLDRHRKSAKGGGRKPDSPPTPKTLILLNLQASMSTMQGEINSLRSEPATVNAPANNRTRDGLDFDEQPSPHMLPEEQVEPLDLGSGGFGHFDSPVFGLGGDFHSHNVYLVLVGQLFNLIAL